jgi:hypothetical protein
MSRHDDQISMRQMLEHTRWAVEMTIFSKVVILISTLLSSE